MSLLITLFYFFRNYHPPITTEVFVKLTHMVTNCMFLFNDKLNKQVDGIGMGFPLMGISFWYTLKR